MAKHSKRYSDPVLNLIVETVAKIAEDLPSTGSVYTEPIFVEDIQINPIRRSGKGSTGNWDLTFEYNLPTTEKNGDFIGDLMVQLRLLENKIKRVSVVYLNSIWYTTHDDNYIVALDEEEKGLPIIKVSIHFEVLG